MICNVGKSEKIFRIVLGIVFVILGVYFSPWFYLLSLIAFVTAFIGFCPLTHLLGMNTCKKSGK